MNEITDDDIKKVANLSRLEVKDEEMDKYKDRLSTIITWIEQLNELDTENIEPMMCMKGDAHLREDFVDDGNKVEEVLSNAPDKKFNFYAVPKFVN